MVLNKMATAQRNRFAALIERRYTYFHPTAHN